MITKNDLPQQDFTVDEAVALLKCERKQVVDLCKVLDQTGDGEFRIGRRGWPSRFSWKKHITPVEGTPIVPTIPLQSPEPKPISTSNQYRPSYVEPAKPKDKRAEVSFYEPGYPIDNSTPGRAKLNEICEKLGLTWGMIKFSSVSSEDGKPQTNATILIGKMHTTENFDEIDRCFANLADTLQEDKK